MMIKSNENEKINALLGLPFWEKLNTEEREMILESAVPKDFEKDQLINSSDVSCMGVVILISGGIRVCLISDEGREITLYRLYEGDCCVTTASCVLSQITFDTLVYATEKSKLIVIPSGAVSALSESNIYFRAFLYETETQRFSQAIWAIQQLLFRRFDQRLASYLLEEYEKSTGGEIRKTQEEIARDVNSAREVVARMLRHFTDEGLVDLKRGCIEIKSKDGLKELL